MTAVPRLRIDGLRVARGGAIVLDGIAFEAGAGEILALLGVNGAGKSSLIRAIAGLEPAPGNIFLDGEDIAALSPEKRHRHGIGLVPEGRRVFPGMSVRENLEVAATDGRAARQRQIDAVFALFPDLAAKTGEAAWRLSGGQQQMLALGRALAGSPRLLLLDEPSLGLAPRLVEALLDEVRRIAADGVTILLAEQNAPAALAVADRAIVLRGGGIADSGPAGAFADPMRLRRALLGA
ncbi:MAG: ABC transporter ATP-binding protein [Rhodospirillaceae bacterium]|jgi:branched-chain amino acid transport system ATP-binding protein|nr:ABC transporter ATP-binding protein [Rhodospirillaceae bacterium]MBT6119259.1 ABC transporter ATP-binding protein [Rhodospirillaceae bacterium]